MRLSVVCVLLVESALCQLNFGGNQQATRNFPTATSSSEFGATKEFTHRVNQKFFNFNRCCRNAERYCNRPCAGQECAANCRVQCGFLGGLCPAVSCSVANPLQCTGGVTVTTTSTTAAPITSSCDPGYTLSGSKCYRLVSSSANYLQAVLGCVSLGASLASVSSQAEQDAVFALTGAAGAWIGLTDFLNEGTFSWVDEAPVTFTNWRVNQPNNGNNNQHCTQIRPDGDWDDVICDKQQAYVCQKNARP